MPTNMADQVVELDLFLAVAKDWDVFLTKPITTKHQSVFWLVSQSRRMSAICVGSCRWISLAMATADPVVWNNQLANTDKTRCSYCTTKN